MGRKLANKSGNVSGRCDRDAGVVHSRDAKLEQRDKEQCKPPKREDVKCDPEHSADFRVSLLSHGRQWQTLLTSRRLGLQVLTAADQKFAVGHDRTTEKIAGQLTCHASAQAARRPGLTSLHSNTQLDSPSSSTSFQYLKPTSVRPATLRTFQKSSERRTTTMTICAREEDMGRGAR